MKGNDELPEISCDFHARWTAEFFSLETVGTKRDLARLGVPIEQLVGREFIFNGGLDQDEDGVYVDILCRGTIQKHPEWGYVAVCKLEEVRRRRQRAQQVAHSDGPVSGGSSP